MVVEVCEVRVWGTDPARRNVADSSYSAMLATGINFPGWIDPTRVRSAVFPLPLGPNSTNVDIGGDATRR